MERRNEGAEASDFAGRRGLSNMVGLERGGASQLRESKDKDARENDAYEICNARGIPPAKTAPG